MANVKDIKGLRFGKLVALSIVGRDKFGQVIWKCECDCGKTINVLGGNLRNGKTRSCGCYRDQYFIESKTTHGMTKTPLYNVWACMRQRVRNPNHKNYSQYGGRGIRICNDWSHFENFKEWALNNGYREDLEIDRIDVNGDYEPNNCRWVTHLINANNCRTNRLIDGFGETHTIAEWGRLLNIEYGKLHYLISMGQRIEDICNKRGIQDVNYRKNAQC